MTFSFPLVKSPQEYFAPFLDEPYTALLETTLRRPGARPRSIILVRPRYLLTGGAQGARLRDVERGAMKRLRCDFFTALHRFLTQHRAPGKQATLLGAGVFSYELNRALEKLPPPAGQTRKTESCFFFTGTFVILDHARKRGQAVAPGTQGLEWLKAKLGKARALPSFPRIRVGKLRSDTTRKSYCRKVETIKRFIRAGDIYQANLTQEFSAPAHGGPAEHFGFYQRLARVSPSEFSAFLKLGPSTLVSSSPERFLKIDPDGGMESRPIKGTRARTAGASARAARFLRRSAKDRAENLMIVDLVRNDLGRVAVPGTVRVRRLFSVETFSTLHHLVSSVTARLEPRHHPVEAVAAAFPPGSMTGAPKIRAMEILTSLERRRRGAYAGALGWIGNHGALDLSVVIRTVHFQQGKLRFAVGGAVVAGSVPAREYRESLSKAAGIFKALRLR